MKKFLALGCLTALLFASCSDDDSSSVDMSKLVGKWYNASITANGQTIPYDDNEVCGKDYIEFTSDKVVKQVDVYDCDGNTPVSDSYSGTYSTDGNKITITIFEQSATATVTRLDGNTLSVTYKEDFDEDGDTEDVTETYTKN